MNTVENIKDIKELTDFSGNSYDILNNASKVVGAIKDGAKATGAIGGDFILDENFKIVGFKISLSKAKNLSEYALKNILAKAEGHSKISTSIVRDSKVIKDRR